MQFNDQTDAIGWSIWGKYPVRSVNSEISPFRSLIFASVLLTDNNNPSISAKICRFLLFVFFTTVNPWRPPLYVILTDWLSTIAEKGEAVFPSTFFNFFRNAVWTFLKVPPLTQARYWVYTDFQGGNSLGKWRYEQPVLDQYSIASNITRFLYLGRLPPNLSFGVKCVFTKRNAKSLKLFG